jgi:pSer/pThr/pTyr-binding forkhead associated (FHA) protein
MVEIEFREGPLAGRRIPLADKPLTLGRHPEQDITLEDNAVSSLHAELRPENGGWLIVDLGSSNGTLVNGLPVRRAVLHSGDRIELGASTVVYVATRDEEGADR